MGEFLAIFALVLFSTNIIVTKLASARLDLNLGFLISITFNVIFASLLLGVQLLTREEPFYWDWTNFWLFLSSGFFATYLGRFLFFKTIQTLGPAKASAFQVTNPVFTAVIAWMFLDEALSLLDMGAIIVILCGLILVSYVPRSAPVLAEAEAAAVAEIAPQTSIWQKLLRRNVIQKGAIIALLSALAYAVGNVLRGAAIRDWNEPIFGALVGAALGMVLHLLFNKHTRQFIKQIKVADNQALYLYMFSGVLTVTAQSCLIASMRLIPITIANLITLSTPVLVTPLSYFLLKNQEGISVRTIIGIVMVLASIFTIVLT